VLGPYSLTVLSSGPGLATPSTPSTPSGAYAPCLKLLTGLFAYTHVLRVRIAVLLRIPNARFICSRVIDQNPKTFLRINSPYFRTFRYRASDFRINTSHSYPHRSGVSQSELPITVFANTPCVSQATYLSRSCQVLESTRQIKKNWDRLWLPSVYRLARCRPKICSAFAMHNCGRATT